MKAHELQWARYPLEKKTKKQRGRWFFITTHQSLWPVTHHCHSDTFHGVCRLALSYFLEINWLLNWRSCICFRKVVIFKVLIIFALNCGANRHLFLSPCSLERAICWAVGKSWGQSLQQNLPAVASQNLLSWNSFCLQKEGAHELISYFSSSGFTHFLLSKSLHLL